MENPFEIIIEKLTNIEKMLLELPKNGGIVPDNNSKFEELMSIDEVAVFLKLTKPTIYGFCSSRKIPYSKKGKRLYFNKTEINDWISQGRIKTVVERNIEPIQLIIRPRKK
jgi:excisionase family DNA binding protein